MMLNPVFSYCHYRYLKQKGHRHSVIIGSSNVRNFPFNAAAKKFGCAKLRTVPLGMSIFQVQWFLVNVWGPALFHFWWFEHTTYRRSMFWFLANMEPENHLFEKEAHLLQTLNFGPQPFILRGVHGDSNPLLLGRWNKPNTTWDTAPVKQLEYMVRLDIDCLYQNQGREY